MKTKELIRQLQEIDPEGEAEVVVGRSDIYFLEKEAIFYDGLPTILIRDEKKRPNWDIIGFKAGCTGTKIMIKTFDFEDVLWNVKEPIIELDDYAKAHLEKDIERIKKEVAEAMAEEDKVDGK